MEHNNDSRSKFQIPTQSFEDLIWKEIGSSRQATNIPELEVVDIFKIVQLDLSSLVRELSNKKTYVTPI